MPSVVALPFIDEHQVGVAARPEEVWRALAVVLPRAFGGAGAQRFARVVGCQQVGHSGSFPDPGAHVAGFRVVAAEPPWALVLQGRHRFSTYELGFRLAATEDGTCLAATTRADFPGLPGRLYRMAVIGTRGHGVVVRRLLRAVQQRAERVGARGGAA